MNRVNSEPSALPSKVARRLISRRLALGLLASGILIACAPETPKPAPTLAPPIGPTATPAPKPIETLTPTPIPTVESTTAPAVKPDISSHPLRSAATAKDSIPDLLRKGEIINYRYWLERDSGKSPDELLAQARKTTSVWAEVASSIDPSVALTSGIISVKGKKYDTASAHEHIIAHALIETVLRGRDDADQDAKQTTSAKLDRIGALDNLIFNAADAQPYIRAETLNSLARILTTLKNQGVPVPAYWSRMRESNQPDYDPSSDTLHFNHFNPISPLGTVYAEINPDLAASLHVLDEKKRTQTFSQKRIWEPPKNYIFLGYAENFFTWYINDGVSFRSRINFANDPKLGNINAAGALQEVYNAYKKFIGVDILDAAAPAALPTREIKPGDKVKGSANLTNYGNITNATYIVTDSRRRVNVADMEAYNEHVLDLSVDGRVQPARIIAKGDYLQHIDE